MNQQNTNPSTSSVPLSVSMIEDNWDQILSLLETTYEMSPVIIKTWIRTLNVFEIRDHVIYFYVGENLGKHGVGFIRRKGYDSYLMSSIREVLNDPDIEIFIDDKESYINRKDQEEESSEDASSSGYEDDRVQQKYPKAYYAAIQRCNLKKKYTFENFIEGDGNRHALATCVAVADEPGQDMFNPLFLYGDSGLGKTHLIQSIAHYILQRNPDAAVLYVNSEVFTNDIISSIRNKTIDAFREKYRQVDVLIVDDIQDIVGRESTQQEFFNTFNFLYEAGKQIIIASDRPPKEFKSLNERLRSRFEWGVPIDIQAPDYETRVAILKNYADLTRMSGVPTPTVPEDVLKYIAENFVTNVRTLEGALNKIFSYSRLTNEPITIEMAKNELQDQISTDTTVAVTPEIILNIVAAHMNVSTDDIKGSSRKGEIAMARQLVMYLSRELTDKSLQAIGDTVGGKDHTTVYSGCKKIAKLIKEDQQIASTVQTLTKKIDPDKS